MYSTSLGNSVMTSTSCSRGRQKLRFQISRKVRTARDGDRGFKEAPREAEPSRGRCRSRGVSRSHHGAQRSKGPPWAASESVSALCTSLCGAHTPSQQLCLPLSASPVSCPHTAHPRPRRAGAPRCGLQDSRAWGFPAGERSGALPAGTPRAAPAGWTPSCAPLRPAGKPGCSDGRHSSPAVTGDSGGDTAPGGAQRAPASREALAGFCPLPAGAPPTHRATPCRRSPVPPGPAGRERRALEGRHGASRRRPPPSREEPSRPSRAAAPGPRAGPAPTPSLPSARLSPGRAVPPASRPPAAAGRRRAAAWPLPPPRCRAGAAATAVPPPACRPRAGPPPPPPGHGSAPAPPPYFTAAAPPRPRRGAGAGARPRQPRLRPVPPGAASPLLQRRPRPAGCRGLLFTVPCPVNPRPAGTTGAALGFSARCFRCPVPIHPFCAHLAPLPPHNSPFPTHPLHSSADLLSPLSHPVSARPAPFPPAAPCLFHQPLPQSPCQRISSPPQPQGQHPRSGLQLGREGGTAGLGSNPTANPKELCGLFCSIFKPQRPGKLELWEV